MKADGMGKNEFIKKMRMKKKHGSGEEREKIQNEKKVKRRKKRD